jgi:hypothetical protein
MFDMRRVPSSEKTFLRGNHGFWLPNPRSWSDRRGRTTRPDPPPPPAEIGSRPAGYVTGMAVTSFQDLPLADRDRAWDGDAAEKRVRTWAGAEDEPNQKYRDAHVWYDADKKENFTSYKLLIADVIDGRLRAVPRGVMAAANVMEGGRGGADLPAGDVDRVKSHLAKYYKKMGDDAPWERD